MKKDTKEKFAPWTLQMGKIENTISQRRKEIQDEIDRKKAHEQSVRDLRRQEELRDKERDMWEEKFNAELKMTEKKIELERTAKARLASTAADWVRFENMFLTQINSRPISDGEKFGYLLESVVPKVRDRLANLKPGTVGYKTAWERLKKEYGQTKVVVNAHMDEIINGMAWYRSSTRNSVRPSMHSKRSKKVKSVTGLLWLRLTNCPKSNLTC